MHFHRWGNWEDVKIADKLECRPPIFSMWYRQVITQQRRCKVCNRVETHSG